MLSGDHIYPSAYLVAFWTLVDLLVLSAAKEFATAVAPALVGRHVLRFNLLQYCLASSLDSAQFPEMI